MTKQLEDKVAIVTGASSGLGKAIAEVFAAEGAKTVLAARRKDVLDEIAAQINGKGQTAFVVAADVTKEADVARLLADSFAGTSLRPPLALALDLLVQNFTLGGIEAGSDEHSG